MDYLRAGGELVQLLAKHRGDLSAVQADLEADREWARFRARHGLVDVDLTDVATGEPDADATGDERER